MKLPVLRVRQLMFLVVYAALIGQAILLSSTAPPRRPGLPELPHGYIWVPCRAARAALILEQLEGPGARVVEVEANGWSMTKTTDSTRRLCRTLRDADGVYCVPVRGDLWNLVREDRQ